MSVSYYEVVAVWVPDETRALVAKALSEVVRELGIAAPPVRFFKVETDESALSLATRLQELNEEYGLRIPLKAEDFESFTRDEPIRGEADRRRQEVWLLVDQDHEGLVETIAHEAFHLSQPIPYLDPDLKERQQAEAIAFGRDFAERFTRDERRTRSYVVQGRRRGALMAAYGGR